MVQNQQPKNIAVVYKTKYGSTETYAKWIAEESGADLYKVTEINVDQLSLYDTVVYCGGLYAGGMLGFSFIKKNYQQIKRLIVVAVGATTKKEEAVEEVKKSNFTPEMKDHVQLFLLRGGLNYKKMNLIDRLLMFLLVTSLKMKKTKDEEAKGMIASYGKVVNFTNKQNIKSVVDAIKKGEGK